MKLMAKLLAGGIAALISVAALAHSFPEKPIRMILGFAAGGPTDVIARLVAKDMSEILNQSVVVENKTGASGILATDYVAQSAPDGYTILFSAHTLLTNPLLMNNVRFDPIKDFTPVSLICTLPLMLITQPASPFNSVRELVAAAKATPKQLSYASAGVGSSGHLAGALFDILAGIQTIHVPYRGNANAIIDVRSGRVSYAFYPMIGVAEMEKNKQIKVLAAGTPKRLPDFPSVPTMAEVGYPNFVDTVPWLGILTPAHTPAPVVRKLQDAIHKSLNKPETQHRLRELGAVLAPNTSGEFKVFLEQDKQRWARLIKAAGVKEN